MRLTNQIRDGFVASVMSDTPRDAIYELENEAHRLVLEDALAKCPPKVRALWNDKELRPFVQLSNYHFYFKVYRSCVFGAVVVPAANGAYSISPTVESAVAALAAKAHELQKQRLDLEAKLRGVALSCTTRKQLAEALPEFAKYLPAEETKVDRTVPVVANVVADFVKAGWPKGEKAVKK